MPGCTVALVGDLSARRELGKVGTQSDLHLHDFKHDGRDVTVLVPDRYPDQLKCLSYAVLGADAAVLVVDAVHARLGEQILALVAADVKHGIIVLRNYVQPDQIAPLTAGTHLAHWPVQAEEDWAAVKGHLARAPVRDGETSVAVPVDHHFDVKGVGAVVLGVVRSGVLAKGDTLYAYPDKVICPVRSIQCHDVDVQQAVTGDRVGLALRNTKAEQLDRGMVLAPADAALSVHPAGSSISLDLQRSPFAKQPLETGSVIHVGFGMQFVPLRLEAEPPAPGAPGRAHGVLEKPLVILPGETGIAWHVDAPMRVLGRVGRRA